MNHNSLPRQLVQLVGSYGSKFPHHVNFVMGQCVVMYIMCKINFLCTSCKMCNGLAFFHVYYVQTMYAAVTNQVGYIIVRVQ